MDGCRWRHNGTKKDKTDVIKKCYYKLDTPSGLSAEFRREVYNLIAEPDGLRLIHYIGDHTKVQAFPHRNSKTKQGSYSMTLPSTLKSINDSCANKDAHMVYKDAVNSQTSNLK